MPQRWPTLNPGLTSPVLGGPIPVCLGRIACVEVDMKQGQGLMQLGCRFVRMRPIRAYGLRLSEPSKSADPRTLAGLCRRTPLGRLAVLRVKHFASRPGHHPARLGTPSALKPPLAAREKHAQNGLAPLALQNSGARPRTDPASVFPHGRKESVRQFPVLTHA